MKCHVKFWQNFKIKVFLMCYILNQTVLNDVFIERIIILRAIIIILRARSLALAACARKPNVPGSSPAASYVQR